MSGAPSNTCESKDARSVLVEPGMYIISDELICDDGLNVTGTYRVFVRVQGGESQSKDIEILAQSSMGSISRRPSIPVISNSEVVVTSVRQLIVRQGPEKVGKLFVKYEDF